MSTDLEQKGSETLPDRLHRHVDLLRRIEEILREESVELAQACLHSAEPRLGGSNGSDVIHLRAENDQLRQMIAELEEKRANTLERDSEAKLSLEEENAELRRTLHEKEGFIEELRSRCLQASENPEDREAADYEADLNEFRRQLEADRQQLDAEVAHLRARNMELKEAAREAELEMSRERVQLARERVQLERMRDEFRQEAEHVQRNAGVHEHMASVRKLKHEMSERNRAMESPTPANDQPERAAARWRSYLPGAGNS